MMTVIFITSAAGFLYMLFTLMVNKDTEAAGTGLVCLFVIALSSAAMLSAKNDQHPELQKLQQQLIDAGLATHTPVVTESKFELLIGEKR